MSRNGITIYKHFQHFPIPRFRFRPLSVLLSRDSNIGLMNQHPDSRDTAPRQNTNAALMHGSRFVKHITIAVEEQTQYEMKKALGETQTLRAGCKTEPKIFAPPQTPFPGARDGQNLISWRWSLPSPTDPVW